MRAIWYRARAEMRTRWRALIGLVLLVGLGGGVVLGAAMGARRTETAYPRFRAAANASDVLVSVPGTGLEGFYEEVARLPEVTASVAAVGVALEVVSPEPPPDLLFLGAFASVDRAMYAVDRPNLLEGRLADPGASDEVTVNRDFAERVGVRAGAHVIFRLTGENGPFGPPFEVRVVGVTVSPVEVVPLAFTDSVAAITMTPAGFEANARPQAFQFDGMVLSLRPGTDPATFQRSLDRIAARHPATGGGAFIASEENRPAVVQRALRPQVLALAAFAFVVGATMLLVLWQSIGRQLWLDAVEHPTLRAVGMSRGQLLVAGMLRVSLVAVAGAIVAVAVAVVSSPLTPLGPARLAEPDPGVAANAAILAAGSAAIVVGLLLGALIPGWRATGVRASASGAVAARGARPSAPASALARAGLPVSAAAGVRLALEPGRGRTAVPVRTTILGAAAALVAVVASFTFGASLDRLVSTPRLYGQDWNLTLDAGFGAVPRAVIDQALRDPGVQGVSGGGYGRLTIEGVVVPAVGVDPLRGASYPTLIEGRAATGQDEVVLGTATMRRIGVAVGSGVGVEAAGKRATMRVVGRAVFPKLGQGGFTPTALGEGAAVRVEALGSVLAEPGAYSFLAVRADREGAQRLTAALESACKDVEEGGNLCLFQPSLRPADIDNYGRVRRTPFVLTAILGALALATLAHALITSVSRRRRDLAILKTIGFGRRQVAGAISAQATTIAVAALAIGAPLGVAAGRWGWTRFAQQLGVLPDPSVPIVVTMVAAAGALVFANAIALLPARAAARTKPALVLRTE